jgi:hypothetical protein
MLPSQQVISKIETAQNIKAGSGDTDGCNGVVIHAEVLRISETLNLTCRAMPMSARSSVALKIKAILAGHNP